MATIYTDQISGVGSAPTPVDQITGQGETVAYKAPCRVATTANITLSGLQTVDGAALAAGDRVLVRAQTNPVDNGIWIAAAGAWTRARDFDSNRDITKGTRVSVTDGATKGGTEWRITSSNPITVGVSNITFEQTAAGEAALNATNKASPVDADRVFGSDSAASFGLVYYTWTQIKAFLKTYFDTLYQGSHAILSALAGLNGTAGLVEQTGASSFTKRLIGIANATDIPTRADVDSRIATYVAAQDVEVFKGAINCSANPNYPAADAGHVYRVSVAGKIGGASGPNVEVNDRLECVVDGSAAGNHATVGANWIVSQVNIDGAVVGPSSATDNHVVLFDGVTGKLIKSAGALFSALVQTSRSIATQHSLTGGGDLSANRTLSLVNDTASPGNNKVYGTDGSGTRGWKDDPAGGGGLTFLSTTAASGASFGITGIPVGTNRVRLVIDDLSLSGTDNMWFQLGDSGGNENTGYDGFGGMIYSVAGGGATGASAATDFRIPINVAAGTLSGWIELVHIGNNEWAMTYMMGSHNAAEMVMGGGSKTLSGVLTQFLFDASGSNTYDGGYIHVYTSSGF